MIAVINKINDTIKNAFTPVFNEDYLYIFSKPSPHMLFLLIATSPFDCTKFIEKIEKTLETTKICNSSILNMNSSVISTMAGIKELRNNCPFISNKLYNIFGQLLMLFKIKIKTKHI